MEGGKPGGKGREREGECEATQAAGEELERAPQQPGFTQQAAEYRMWDCGTGTRKGKTVASSGDGDMGADEETGD